MLLKKIRLHGYLATYDPERPRSRKVVVLFVGSKMADLAAVEREVQRVVFPAEVKLMVVLTESAKDHEDFFLRLTGTKPVLVDSYHTMREARHAVFDTFCAVNACYTSD
jgi:hypothetical protein